MKKKILFSIVLLLIVNIAVANSVGGISDNLLGPARGLGLIMNNICYVAGVGFLLCGILQYKYHRENPQQVKLSTPITLVILGIVFIGVPFAAMLSSSSKFLK